MSRVDIRESDECWPWTGSLRPDGYATVKWEGRLQPVHRVVYTIQVGPIPDGAEIDHVRARGCIRTDCCNWISHLEAVTPEENNARRELFQMKQTHCRHGHPFDRPSEPGKSRACRECKRLEALRRYRDKHGEEIQPMPAERTHCPSGHPYNLANTYVRPDGRGKHCRVCQRASGARSNAKRQKRVTASD